MLRSKRILVAGDLVLDSYTFGEVERISPEAPVPVLKVGEQRAQPGGAGNVILNLLSLGMKVVPLGRIGCDTAGDQFLEVLAEEEIELSSIARDPTFQTPHKNRMIASGQQLVRIDYENPSALDPALEKKIIASLPSLLEGIEIVAISDYAKGFLTPTLLNALIRQARSYKIPVIIDPKGRDFTRYAGATLLKPNLSEAITAAGLAAEASLDQVADQLLKTLEIETLLITRSQEGISFWQEGERRDFPAQVHEIKDVTGAGDTVLAVLTAALANKKGLAEASELANIAAGIALERIGCARISLEDLAARFSPSN